MNEAIEVLEDEGAIVVDPARIRLEAVRTSRSSPRCCASSRTTSPRYLETYTGPRLPEDARRT